MSEDGSGVEQSSNGARRKVVAVVVHYESPRWLRETVHALAASDEPVFIVIVDNGGHVAGGPEMPLPRSEVLTSASNVGYAGGANLGMRRALDLGATHIVVACHDARPSVTTISRLVEALDADESLGVVGPINDKEGGASSVSAVVEGTAVTPVDWLSGTLLMMRPEVLRVLGGFDAAFESYVEDVEFCRRVAASGWRVGLVDKTWVETAGSSSTSASRLARLNTMRLAWLTGGWRSLMRACICFGYQNVRHAVGAVAPRRPQAQRQASSRKLRDSVWIARQWRRIFAEPVTDLIRVLRKRKLAASAS